MTPAELAQATGARIDRATNFLEHIEAAMAVFQINTAARQAAFLAQIGHESGGLHWTVEIWGPTIAQSNYEGRADLGNTQPGDGFKYRGRGLIQTTGRNNYQRTRDSLRMQFPDDGVPDFEADPEQLALPHWAAFSAADYWDDHDLNALADVGDFMRITRRINGGLNGYDQRLALFEAAKEVLA
jgi:putative chitinase